MTVMTSTQPSENNVVENNIQDNSVVNEVEYIPESVDMFKKFMYQTQEIRRKIVSLALADAEIDLTLLEELKGTLQQLTDHHTISFQREMKVNATRKFMLNLKDEISGLQKDITYFEKLNQKKNELNLSSLMEARKFVELSEILAPYHPVSPELFFKELEFCTDFLRAFVRSGKDSNKPIMVTDWDGTMKDYCSQYATNLQPIYSAIGMAKFAQQFTRLTAVLTAGPLRGPGILDLTSLPIDGPILFSGSWGREWWLKGHRLVHDHDIPYEGTDALNRFNDEMQKLLSDSEYCQFDLVGSGVQWKVDRLTLGVQTVCGHVHPELSFRYQEEIRERMHRVDPNEEILHFDPSTELEVEVVVHNDGTVWNKADGVEKVVNTMMDTLDPPGTVLICGDTASDLPMVRYAVEKNPKGSMSLFVTMKEDLKHRVRELIPDETRTCFVSCPDVIHAAMDRILKEDFNMN
ncbi:hypothetical protein FO519_008709 [Halicephalobus sp. NKZ332]|nr:hypothetical protein FO519_008709 [Halicephalobus sp. NKZ332]